MNEREQHHKAINEFIAHANKMKDDGASIKVVSSALLTASAVYASYSVAGNGGALTDSGIEKMAVAFSDKLRQVRDARRNEADQRAEGNEVSA